MKISVVIEAGSRIATLKPCTLPSLVPIGRELLLNKQIKIIEDRFENADILAVTGYLDREIDLEIRRVYNKDYNETNTAYNIGLGLSKVKYRRALIISGNTIFNKNTLDIEMKKEPLIFTTNECDDLVGCTYNNNILENMFFGLPNRWSGILYVAGESLDQLTKYCLQDKRRFFFEAINDLNRNHPITVIQPKKSKVVLINSNKDIELAKKIR